MHVVPLLFIPARTETSFRVLGNTLCCNGQTRHDLVFTQPRCSGAMFARQLPVFFQHAKTLCKVSKRGTLSFIAFQTVLVFVIIGNVFQNVKN